MSPNFQEYMQLEALEYLLPKLLYKKYEKSVPMSGEEGYKQDCYFMYICDGKEKNPQYLVDSFNMKKGKIHVRSVSDSIPEILLISHIPLNQIKVRHCYKNNLIEYVSLSIFLFHYVTGYGKLKTNLRILKSKLLQKKFNRKKLVTHDPLKILRVILNYQVRNPNLGITHGTLLENLYSNRYYGHPDDEYMKNETNLLLESIVKSRDCEYKDTMYRITEQGIQTIQKHEAEERKFNDSLTVQKGIFLLTIVLTIAALSQANIIEYPSEWKINLKVIWECLIKSFNFRIL